MRNAFRQDRPEYRQLLNELYIRTRVLQTSPPPPAWQTWLRSEWDEQLEHGPRYSSGDWFGVTEVRASFTDAFRRAIQQLADAKLLVIWRRFGRRLTNIKLTPAGLVAFGRAEMSPSVFDLSTTRRS